MSVRARRITGALGVCAVAAGCALFGAPAAFGAQEATPPELPGNVAAAIDDEHLHVELSHGWQAVTGPAADVEIVRIAAATDGLGTITGYTGNDETGRAILIFTGNDLPEFGVSIDGATIRSEDNDTDQSWYVYNDDGEFDAAVPANTAQNIPPADLADFTYNPGLNGGHHLVGGATFRLG